MRKALDNPLSLAEKYSMLDRTLKIGDLANIPLTVVAYVGGVCVALGLGVSPAFHA